MAFPKPSWSSYARESSSPLMDAYTETGLFNLARNAHALAVVLALTEDSGTQIALILEELEKHLIQVLKKEESKKWEPGRSQKRVVFLGNKVDGLVKSQKIRHSCESRSLELLEITGFPLPAFARTSFAGMTKMGQKGLFTKPSKLT